MVTRRPPAHMALRRRLTRRRALGLGGAAVVSASLKPPRLGATLRSQTALGVAATDRAPGELDPATVDALRPNIRPRSDWAGDLPVTGEILPEEDVRFLLVHHTASTNDYESEDVAAQIREFYTFHTGPEKGWPDVAYNFFVDRFGGVWEARAGSIEAAVRGDATGGSQGHAMLCSLIGNHSTAEVTDAAKASMTGLLAWLAARHEVDTSPGTTVEFTSRGSNRWPTGTLVTAKTISGHRDMSQTTCPGDFAYSWLETELPAAVTESIVAAVSASTVTVVPAPDESTTTTTAAPATTVTEPETDGALATGPADGDSAGGDGLLEEPAIIAGGVAALGAAVVAAIVRIKNRTVPG